MGKSILIDLTGMRFGGVVVLGRSGTGMPVVWNVVCDCGRTNVVDGRNLKTGKTKSCGCGMNIIRHGQSGGCESKPTGAYKSWKNMIQRCTNSEHEKYPRYGGRGISVCDRWMTFDNFFADMGERPAGMTIERKHNDKNYELANCEWAISRTQSRNKSSTVVSFDDVQEIIGRFEHGEKQASIGRRFGIDVGYIGKIIQGKTWPEIDRPYLNTASQTCQP